MEAAQHGVRDVERAPAAPDKAKATPPPSRLGRGIAGALSVTLVVGIVLVAVVATGAKKNNNKSGAGAGEAEPPRLITGAVGCPSRSYYAGSRAACLAEVPDASHCPDEFPTWTEDGADEPDCALAVVGAGAGGLYAAWRLVEAGTYAASDVCVFEATERVGGRTYSVRYGALDLAVDAGAYRTWPEYTPVTHALIVEKLGLSVACYDPAEDPCEKFILVDEAGHNAGFATYVEELATALFARGARWFPRRRVASVAPRDPGLALTFASGAQATAEKTILNIPQRPLLEIMRGSPALGLDASAFAAAHAVQTEVVTKLYLYYDVAWWRALGLTSGDFKLDGDAANMPLKGRYHDGDVVCDDEDDPSSCRGFLLAVYDHDYSGEAAMFFRRYQRERPEPVTILSGATPEGAAFLAHAHERLLECHVYMEDPPYTAYEASTVIGGADPPTFGVLATWNAATLGAGGGWHGWTDLGLSDAMPAALAAHGAFVVNEAYSLVQGWAEGSLQVADAVLEEHFGLARPWDFAASEYPVHVAQTAKAACEAATATVPNGTSGGDTGAYDDDALCFLGNASLLLADGRRVPLAEARVGDRVATGFGGAGTVTKVLKHAVDAGSVALIAAANGLVGTATHPIYLGGAWVPLDRIGARTAVAASALYNLEIDGDRPGASNHSYVVGGVVASGLGDGVELNARFRRQASWQKKTVSA